MKQDTPESSHLKEVKKHIFEHYSNYRIQYDIKEDITKESKATFFKLEDAELFLKQNNLHDYKGWVN